MTAIKVAEDAHLQKSRSPRWKLIVGATLLIVVCFSWLLFFARSEPEFPADPLLVKTTYPTGMFSSPPNASVVTRLLNKYLDYKRKKYPNPLNWSFPVSTPSRCSVHGLLNQCMEVTGMQYVIEKKVAGGSIQFGSAQVQNGAQWCDSFEKALQAGPVEFWDADRKSFRQEGIVLLRFGTRTTLVLSQGTAKEYEEKYPSLKRANQAVR